MNPEPSDCGYGVCGALAVLEVTVVATRRTSRLCRGHVGDFAAAAAVEHAASLVQVRLLSSPVASVPSVG